MKLYDHQKEALERTKEKTHVAYYHDQGLGKTFTGAEKMKELNTRINLVICQKSKVDDWVDHFNEYYSTDFLIFNLTNNIDLEAFMSYQEQEEPFERVGVINYDLIFRRPELLKLKNFTLMLDESSIIQHKTSKRTKFILKLQPANIILLSGTPTGGKYENLWTQIHLLGWNISEKMYRNHYLETEWLENDFGKVEIVTGYKNVDRLKRKMRQIGCDFLKTEECIDLPDQIDQKIKINSTKEYRIFKKDSIIKIGDTKFKGDCLLNKMTCERQLCANWNQDKLDAFSDLLESTSDRIIVFYNFITELDALEHICGLQNRAVSRVNGQIKDLYAYENKSDSVTLIQYQAGSMGLNLQKANKIIYFTPPLSSELFEQSKKRIHRIGQNKTCFYYYLVCRNSIEEKIYKTLAMRKDYTEALFEEEKNNE